MPSRFLLADSVVREISASAPTWRFFVPGRIEVFGKHTDYAGGRSLVAAVPRGFAVAAAPASDHRVVVVKGPTRERFTCSLNALPARAPGWRQYVLVVVRRLASNFPGVDLSCRIAFTSDLPRAAGISSSSALVVGLTEAFIARAQLHETVPWREAIRSNEDRAAYFGCIENGASFGSLRGDAGVGTHGGSEDHAAIVLSRAGELRQFAFSPLRLEEIIGMPAGWTFAVAFSGVHAAKAGARQAAYNQLATACAAIVAAWRGRHPGDERSLGALARAAVLSEVHLAPALARRLEHFLAEDQRVVEAAEAFAHGDIGRIAQIADASHGDAARLLGNQVPETNDLAAMARAEGAAASSAFGAGWGGSVWALVRTIEAEGFLERWLRAYRTRYPRHRATGFISPPSDGIVRA